MDDIKQLTAEIGHSVEAVGRMLQRKPPLTLEDLDNLRTALEIHTVALKHIQDTTVSRYQ